MTLTFIAKLILSGKLKFEDGAIKLGNNYLTLIQSSLLSNMIKELIKDDKSYIIYLSSWITGFLNMREIIRIYNLKTGTEIYNIGMKFLEAMGIGLYKTHDYYPGRYTHFVIRNNPFMKWLYDMKETVDYLIAGGSAGGGCFVHNSLCQNVELKCMAMGDPYCEFLTGTEKELKSRGLWDVVRERYKLEKILPIQRYVYENVDKISEAELVEKVSEMINKL